MDKNYTATIEVAKSPQEVFNCLTEVTKWWSKDFEGYSAKLNDEFVIHHPGQHYSKQNLIEFIPNLSIVWLVTESRLYWLTNDQQEWTDTKMNFGISHRGNKTSIHFTHEGLTPDKECYEMCAQGWNIVFKNWLFYYLTTREPCPEMEKAAEIRNRLLQRREKL